MSNSKKIIKNTAILYSQLIIAMIFGLFTTRLILNALGETNYGIYMLVAGVVGMLGILNSNMSNTSMRFMAHSLGSGDKELIHKTFNTTLFLHFVIGLIVVILMEIAGYLMFDYLLNIPADKISDAKIVFQFMIITTFITVISVPYDAVMNAHENMLALSLVDFLGTVLKLALAIYLLYSDGNLLVLYGFLMLIIQVLQRVIKQMYSKLKYEECKIKFRKYIDRKLLKSILSFTGWNLLGSIGAVSVIQIRSILLNMFFGVKINAAEGISNNATSQINMVSVSMTRAINPQLIKSEGGGDRKKMIRITEISTKFSVFLFSLFAIPVLLETKFLLHLWLKVVPDYTVIFTQIIIIAMFIEKFTYPIADSIRAIGTIRNFQITETFFQILTVPIAYVAFKMGYNPISIYLVSLIANVFIFFSRLYFGQKVAGIHILNYVRNAILPVFIPLFVAGFVAYFLHFYMTESILRLFLVAFVFMSLFTVIFWMKGLLNSERDSFKQIVFSVFLRIKRKNNN